MRKTTISHPKDLAVLGKTAPDPSMVRKVMGAMRAWRSPEQDMCGQTTVFWGGEVNGKFDLDHDADAHVRYLNALAAIEAITND